MKHPLHHPEFTTMQRLDWYSRAVHAGKAWKHVERLRQTRLREFLGRDIPALSFGETKWAR